MSFNVGRFQLLTIVMCVLAGCLQPCHAHASSPPNVVLILADDLGYGDVSPLNPDSSIPTPAFDRLALEGLTFTDAHTPSAVCTPTRYGLLTGRYCWRTHLKRGVLNGYGKPLIEQERDTLGSVMQRAGYHTAVVGKWHLGLGLHMDDSSKGDPDSLDLTQPLSHHPGTVGFDSSFVIPASLDFPPYVYFEDGQATTSETVPQAKSGFPKFLRQGPRAVDFDMRGCLDRLTEETIQRIESFKETTKPDFLYFPLTAPHKPVLPSEKFTGSSDRGPYGDFIRQVDDVIGRVLNALDQNNVAADTLVIVTSDNGSFMHKIEEGKPDHVQDHQVQGFHPQHHRSNSIWRGTKADIWEAGHRVPFFVRLPGNQHAGTRLDQVVGLVDVMSTLTEFVGCDTPESAGPDSFSFAPLLRNPTAVFDRPPLICHSSGGMFAIRDGRWKLVAGNGSGGRQAPKGKPFAEPWMLFDLQADPGETRSVAQQQQEVFARLKTQLLAIKGND